MDDEIVAFFLGAVMVLVPALLIAWWFTLRRLVRVQGRGPRRAPPEDRIDRLAQQVDDLTAKVEHLARGQEFLAQVLSRRREVRPVPVQEAVENTPG